jgi:hypothetical protein
MCSAGALQLLDTATLANVKNSASDWNKPAILDQIVSASVQLAIIAAKPPRLMPQGAAHV